ncbi:MAG: hopanoid-associated sugar epimerase [Pararhizobium sp.]
MNGSRTPLLSGDRALVTGASGFVGSAIVRRLLGDGITVRVLVRPTSSSRTLAGLDVERVEGDLRQRATLRPALADVRWLFHVAADYRLWARNPAELFQTNVEGTRTLMTEASEAGVERIVYTSSVATLPASTDGVPRDESVNATEAETVGAYKKSKLEAEAVVSAMATDGLPVVIVNPSTPIGPFDVRPTPTGRLILEAARGRVPAYVDTGLNMVHVDDVAEGHVAALVQGRTGERYILGGQNATLKEILATVAAEVGRRPPKFAVPRAAVVPVAIVSEAVARLTGREPLTTLEGLKMSKKHMFFTSRKAEQELGYRARPYREGIRDAVAWFRQAGSLD